MIITMLISRLLALCSGIKAWLWGDQPLLHPQQVNTGLWLVNTNIVTWILASDWSILITWPVYWPLIGRQRSDYWPLIGQYRSCNMNTDLWLAAAPRWWGRPWSTGVTPGRGPGWALCVTTTPSWTSTSREWAVIIYMIIRLVVDIGQDLQYRDRDN